MTDKQIMINSVDVSGCSDISGYVNDFGEYECLCRCIFGDGTDDYGVIGHEMCKDNPNCHYKKWQRKEQEYLILATLIRNTKTYSDVCDECKDEILLYPSISGRTNYKQIEVEERALKNIINKLKESI